MSAVLEPRSPAWHDERRKGIGSSDAAAILGLSRHSRPIDIYLDKLGEREPSEDTAFTEWGRRLEAVIAEAAEDALNAGRGPDERVRFTQWTAAIHCKEWWPAFTHLDRRGRVDGLMTALECKSGMGTRGWGDPATVSIVQAHEVIPPDYAVQVGHHLLCSGYAAVYVAALIGYRDFRLYRIERDEEWLADLLADEQEFWRLVETRTPPDPDGSDAYRAFLSKRIGSLTAELSATPEQQLIGARAIEAKRAADAAAGVYELERQRLDRSMGDAVAVTGPGWKATRTAPRTSTAWQKVVGDIAPFGLNLTPFIEKHTKVGEPGFRFLPDQEE